MDLDSVRLGAIIVTNKTSSASLSGIFGRDESLLVDLGGYL
jgi:hypothetical protein